LRSNRCYVLKADIKQYFDNIDHEILLEIIRRKISDPRVLWLIKQIFSNHKTKVQGKGMPLGNLTSQFFANVYLNELDYFVKHTLKAKYYLRYVDDFVILHDSNVILGKWQHEIDGFLKSKLKVELHPDKSRIVPFRNGITLLGFRVFYRYRLLKKSNARRIWKRLDKFKQKYQAGNIEKEKISQSLDGWFAYAKFANTYNLRMKVASAFVETFNTEKEE
jgi:RNA-directed DNA polymerase